MPRLLDAYCGGGGAAMGYYNAGFDNIVGVDIDPKMERFYPFKFVQGDAIEYIREHGDEFDLIHASPPCQAYSPHVSATTLSNSEALIAETREALRDYRYVIENVTGAWDELIEPVLLCGLMFGMPISRHRLFEIHPAVLRTPEHPPCIGAAQMYADERGWDIKDMRISGKGANAGALEKWQEITGIDWYMPLRVFKESIPPAFTEYLGRKLI